MKKKFAISTIHALPLDFCSVLVYNICIKGVCRIGEKTMSEMNEYTPDLFELIDEEGNKKQFELFDAAEINGEQYFAMLPAVEDDDFLNSDCELVILKSVEEDGEEILVSIDDEDEFETVSSFFMERLQDALEE
jgi:uncharacterized protein YrzB (UPF0473 family)